MERARNRLSGQKKEKIDRELSKLSLSCCGAVLRVAGACALKFQIIECAPSHTSRMPITAPATHSEETT